MSTIKPATARVLAEISAERDRAAELYPDCQQLPDGTGLTGATKHALNIARHACERAHREGRLTHRHILEEEFWEVMDESDREKLRKELVQVGGRVLAWIEDIDRQLAEGASA
jgi:hypothetical protein